MRARFSRASARTMLSPVILAASPRRYRLPGQRQGSEVLRDGGGEDLVVVLGGVPVAAEQVEPECGVVVVQGGDPGVPGVVAGLDDLPDRVGEGGGLVGEVGVGEHEEGAGAVAAAQLVEEAEVRRAVVGGQLVDGGPLLAGVEGGGEV